MAAFELLHHIYWHRKPKFDLSRDRYDYWTIFAVTEGTFRYRIGEETGEAGFGDLIACPPGEWFGRETLSPLSFHVFHFHLSSAEGGAGARLGVRLTIGDTERLASDYRYLELAYGQTGEETRSRAAHLFNDLLMLRETERLTADDRPPGAEPIDPLMAKAKRLLDSSWQTGEMQAMGQIAESLGLTPVQLTRRFQRAYGLLPSDFVKEQRLRLACCLLKETTLSLDRIAERCGYETGPYLSRVFLSAFGIRPSEYRRSHRI